MFYTYCIVINGFAYVGVTDDPSVRWCAHLRELLRGTHNNRFLQGFYSQYPNLISFVVIDTYETKQEALQREKQEIIKLGEKSLNIDGHLDKDRWKRRYRTVKTCKERFTDVTEALEYLGKEWRVC